MDVTANLQHFDLSAKTAIVTGASRGIGRHIAQVLVDSGVHVVGMARNQETLEAAGAQISTDGHFHAVVTDVADAQSAVVGVDKAIEAVGAIDVLVNAVGTTRPQRFLDIDESTWEYLLASNVSSVYRMSRCVATTMVEAGTPGSIINISSILSERVALYQAGFSAAKAAVTALTQNMAHELSRDNIRVNALELGYFATKANQEYVSTPQGERFVNELAPRRLGALHELDGAVQLLASAAGSYITGTTITIDGGASLPIR